MYHHNCNSNVCNNNNEKQYGRSSNNQCMSSFMQLLNPEAEQHLVGKGFFWRMLDAQDENLASLSAETMELVYNTVDTLRMLV